MPDAHLYGFSFKEMKTVIEPHKDSKLWGARSYVNNATYYMEHLFVVGNQKTELFFRLREGAYYLCKGSAFVLHVSSDGKKARCRITEGDVFTLPRGIPHGFYAEQDCSIYFFSGPSELEDHNADYSIIEIYPDINQYNESIDLYIHKTTDYREKYWGSIETIVSKEYCAKKIVMKPNTQNSLEFHCHKHETYWIEEGKVMVGLRVGRAENRSVILDKGQAFSIPPGLMHMKIAHIRCVILEISTKDDDSDSHIVEDGNVYKHLED